MFFEGEWSTSLFAAALFPATAPGSFLPMASFTAHITPPSSDSTHDSKYCLGTERLVSTQKAFSRSRSALTRALTLPSWVPFLVLPPRRR